MADELIERQPKNILIVFDLEPRDAARDAANLHATYIALAELGFLRVTQNILLPTKSVMGLWFGEDGVEQIRTSIVSYLLQKDLPLQRIVVAHFDSCAWIGTPIP